MKHYKLLYLALMSSVLLTACKDTDDLTGSSDGLAAESIIQVGGINTDELVATASVTRAVVNEETVTKTDAENISWLVKPLEEGLDITYGLSSNRTGTSRVAILKLLTTTGVVGGPIKYSEDGTNKYAEYSFLYRNNTTGDPTSDPAIWYGNGAHFFEGLYIPEKIQYNVNESKTVTDVYGANGTAPYLNSDQHDDTATGENIGNYTLLSHYLGMPSNYTLNATVARIKLPFRHRLARVLAYILIDPEMGSGVKIQGYKKTYDGKTDTVAENPTSSKIRFSNVKVLAGVKDSYDAETKHHTYTPQWMEIRKAVPHFVGERGSYNDRNNTSLVDSAFVAFYNANDKTYIYPDDTDWATINAKTFTDNKSADGYERTIYGKVPVYDLIVRPTYTSLANVMYDEEGVNDSQKKQDLYTATNQIDFEITLNNGLQYEKRFTFDLNANYQTVVYLHISKERVDYNSSGSELWVETRRDDEYYGVNNQNGNTLSLAGSSWQRAYTNKDQNYNVTDGHQYQQDNEDMYAQYVDDATWIEMLREACVGGKHHGDYFILDRNISIPAAAFPANFVFTGHLDGQDHTITLTNASYTPATDTYETWTTGGGFKYVQSGSEYVKFVADANTTYYEKDGDNYTAIENFQVDAYTGSVVYTKGVNTTYNLVSQAWNLTAGTYYKKNGSNYEPIDNITSYLNEFNGHIYTRQQNPDSYTAVTNPTTENPHDQGWYEKVDETTYKLTEDTGVQAEKTYYTKNPVSFTYTAVTDVTTLQTDVSYYKNTGEETYEPITNINEHIGVYNKVDTDVYTAINFYKKVHHPGAAGSATSATNLYMFSGLNGNYTTAQETNESNTWEANVHKETRDSKTYWVPYKGTSDGWRAEVINLNVAGGTLFKSDVTYPPTENATVTGYVHNCWLNSTYSGGTWSGGTKVTEYTPEIPKY